MFVFGQLSLQWIALVAAGCICAGFIYTDFRGSRRLFSKWPYVVIIGCAYWLNTSLPLEAEASIAALLTLIYWVLLKSWNRNGENPPHKMAMWLGSLLPIAVPIAIYLEPNVIYFYYRSLWLTLGIGICLSLLLLALMAKTKKWRPFLYAFLLLGFSTITHFESSDIYSNHFNILLAALETYSAYLLLKDLRSEMLKALNRHKDIEASFDKQVELEVKKRTFYMELTKERMAEINRTDHLTKLLNRKSVLADIETLILDKQVTMFCLFVFDIDYFKQINDSLGHATGDVCLKNLSALVKRYIDEDDLAGRYGGDEFIIALPNKGFKEGLEFARTLMAEISKQSNPEFTISMGMAVYPWDGENYKRLFEIADKGLYAAKEAGRKRLGYKGYIKPQASDFHTEH